MYHKDILLRACDVHKHFSRSSGHATTPVGHKCYITYNERRFAALSLYLCLLRWIILRRTVRVVIMLSCVAARRGNAYHLATGSDSTNFPTWNLHQQGWSTDTMLERCFLKLRFWIQYVLEHFLLINFRSYIKIVSCLSLWRMKSVKLFSYQIPTPTYPKDHASSLKTKVRLVDYYSTPTGS